MEHKKYTKEELTMIRSTVAKGTSDDELFYFLSVAEKSGLSAILKEVWCYKDNKGNMLVFTGRDGLMKIAQLSGEYDGMTSAVIYEKDKFTANTGSGTVEHETGVPGQCGGIVGSYAIAYRKGFKVPALALISPEPFTWLMQQPWSVWKKDTQSMMLKVAQSKALKMLFGSSSLQLESDFEIDRASGTVECRDHKSRVVEELKQKKTGGKTEAEVIAEHTKGENVILPSCVVESKTEDLTEIYQGTARAPLKKGCLAPKKMVDKVADLFSKKFAAEDMEFIEMKKTEARGKCVKGTVNDKYIKELEQALVALEVLA